MSVILCFFKRSTIISMIGRFTMGIMGLGRLMVKGRIRVPKPPAIMTAFMETPMKKRVALTRDYFTECLFKIELFYWKGLGKISVLLPVCNCGTRALQFFTRKSILS